MIVDSWNNWPIITKRRTFITCGLIDGRCVREEMLFTIFVRRYLFCRLEWCRPQWFVVIWAASGECIRCLIILAYGLIIYSIGSGLAHVLMVLINTVLIDVTSFSATGNVTTIAPSRCGILESMVWNPECRVKAACIPERGRPLSTDRDPVLSPVFLGIYLWDGAGAEAEGWLARRLQSCGAAGDRRNPSPPYYTPVANNILLLRFILIPFYKCFNLFLISLFITNYTIAPSIVISEEYIVISD